MAKKKKSAAKKTSKKKKSAAKTKKKSLAKKSSKKPLRKKQTGKKSSPKKARAKKSPTKKSKSPPSKKDTDQQKAPAPGSGSGQQPSPEAPTVKTPELGSNIPDITLEDLTGKAVSLKDIAGQNPYVVLYLYPKDDTPGCTKQACDFRDNISHLQQHGATVIGVSTDTKESHQNFSSKYGLNYTLLSDPKHELAEKLGAWKKKNFMGNAYNGIERSTFLYNNAKLSRVWQPVSVGGHVDDVLSAIHHTGGAHDENAEA